MAALRADFRTRGWHRKATGRVLLELAFHLALSLGGIALFLSTTNLWLELLGLAVSSLGSAGVATNTHTASHCGASDRPSVNELLAYFGYPFFLHLPLSYWRNAHIAVHHASPNVVGIDDDADFAPFFAVTDREVEGARGLRRFYYRHQWLFFVLICGIHPITRAIAGWTFLLRALADPKRRRLAHWLDLAALLMNLVVWIGVPSFFFPFTHVLGFWFLREILLGYPVLAILAPGHYPAEAGMVLKGDWEKNFIGLQTAATVNFRAGPFGIFCSGLDHQIEHHLFPGFSHVHYGKMSGPIRELCEREGYPYRTLGWVESLWKTIQMFRRPKRAHGSLEELMRSTAGAAVEADEPALQEPVLEGVAAS